LQLTLSADCAQLTKANSIEGNKKDNITVIYTPWSNLHKTNGMETGQVGFKKDKLVKKVHIDMRVNVIVNRLNKTREEKFPDLQAERIEYDKQVKQNEIAARQKRNKEELRIARERKQLAYDRDHAYEDLYSEESLRHSSNQFRDENWEDDFM
jgi:hypothetical protein